MILPFSHSPSSNHSAAGNEGGRQEPVVRFQCGQRHDRKIRFPDRFIKNRTGVSTNPRNNYTYFQSYQLMVHAPIVAFDERRMDSIFKQEKEGRLAFCRPSINNRRQRRPLSRFWKVSSRLYWVACFGNKTEKGGLQKQFIQCLSHLFRCWFERRINSCTKKNTTKEKHRQ